MSKMIGVRFQQNGKIYSFDSNGIEAAPGQFVIANTSRGVDLGEVVTAASETDNSVQTEGMKKIIRLATEDDVHRATENRQKEREAFSVCQSKISEHKLEMKLVSVEYAFDNSKILFYFTANGRVDFRSLVKDLASVFRMRIELRQIGVRDEAKMLGGLGPCGRPICCRAFLDQFQPVSIKMAKEQNLSLNPTKISGLCGRLMCCLKYEQDHYEQTRKKMPRVGKDVSTPDGIGQVTELNVVKETVSVRLTNGDTSEIHEYPMELVSRVNDRGTQPAEHETKTADTQKEHIRDTQKIAGDSISDKPAKEKKKEKKNDQIIREREAGSQDNRNKQKGRENQLGRPVRRENPNRTEHSGENENEKNYDASRVPAEVTVEDNSSDTQKAKTSSWADAVQSAMKAMDRKE